MLAVAALIGTVLTLAFSSVATAGGIITSYYTDPQNTNVPYVAWDGEQIRLVKCFVPGLTNGITAVDPAAYVGRFVIEDWSGNEHQKPVFENSGLGATDGTAFAFAGVGEQADRLCFATDIVSLKPGLAVIKLVVEPTGTTGQQGPNQGAPVAKHQFLAIWMDIASLTATELNGAPNPTATTGITVGDFGAGGTATNIFNTPFANGLVDVRVTGSFPLGNNFAGMAANDTVTLPNDWVWLAQHFALEQAPFSQVPGDAFPRWDIHDSLSWDPLQALDGPANHSTLTGCPGLNAPFDASGNLRNGRFDTVDNCLGGPETGPFSSLFGTSLVPTDGPFDPLRPADTLLSDGLVNAGDAPMPAARITVQLTGTAGAIIPADKHVLYSRNGTGAASAAFPNNAHNLYAPFYRQWIPATQAPPTASGIDGPSTGNDFAGFLVAGGLYHNWDLIVLSSRGGVNACLGALGEPLALPTGPDRVVVYTDEHGEAIFGFNPNAGFALAADSNNRCAAVAGPVTFTADINVQAGYPYQQPFSAPRPAASVITKTVNTAASKALSCVPKGLNEMFCVETIRNLQGQLVANAPVAFSRTPRGNIEPDAALHGGFDTRGQVVDLANSTADVIIIRTNALGQAGVVVTESLTPPNPNSCVDVKAENLGTAFPTAQPGVFNPAIKVFQQVTPATGAVGCAGIGGAPAPAAPAAGGSTNTSTGNTTTSNPTQTQTSVSAPVSTSTSTSTGVEANTTIVTLNGNVTPTKAETAAKVQRGTLAYVRVIYKQQTGRQLLVRVNGKAKTAKLVITLKGANGKLLSKAVRFVPTNKEAVVKNLRLSAKVKTVAVSVA